MTEEHVQQEEEQAEEEPQPEQDDRLLRLAQQQCKFFLQRIAQLRAPIESLGLHALPQRIHQLPGGLHADIGSNERFLQLIPQILGNVIRFLERGVHIAKKLPRFAKAEFERVAEKAAVSGFLGCRGVVVNASKIIRVPSV